MSMNANTIIQWTIYDFNPPTPFNLSGSSQWSPSIISPPTPPHPPIFYTRYKWMIQWGPYAINPHTPPPSFQDLDSANENGDRMLLIHPPHPTLNPAFFVAEALVVESFGCSIWCFWLLRCWIRLLWLLKPWLLNLLVVESAFFGCWNLVIESGIFGCWTLVVEPDLGC